MSKACVILTTFLLAAQTVQAQLQINELLAINSTVVYDPDFGEFSDFAELRNTSSNPVNLAGYALSDNAAGNDRWTLPALVLGPGEYLVVWTDGQNKQPGDSAFVAYKNAIMPITALHASFRLSGDGEFLGLYNPQGNLIDGVTYCVQTSDIAYGRSASDPSQWLYFGEPTPGATNSPYGSATMETPGEPQFSLGEGVYPLPQTLLLTAQEPGAVIRFTFDGTTPHSGSPIFPDNFPLDLSLVIKARLYVPGKMPGKVVTKSYFINENTQLPILSIASDASNLYGFDFGILQNAIKDREVPVTLEYFEPATGQRAFQAGVGLRIFGTSIYNLPQRPLSVRFKEKFGDEILRYPLFEGKPIAAYTAFLLRNGGNDYNTAFFRDGLAVNLVKGKMDIDYQDYKPCLVFINGEYNGIYEMRERLDEPYIGSNHEINPDNLDYLEDSLQLVAGDAFEFKALFDFIQQNDLSDPLVFSTVEAKIDLNEFINYLINRAFIGYQIADLNNRYWRNRDTDGKWRWIAADMEHAFGQLGGDHYTENTISKLAGFSGNLPEWATLFFNKLLDNPGFRDEFIQRSAAWLNTIYRPDVTLAVTDSLAALLQPHLPRHIGRWHTPPSMQAWQNNVNFIKTFLENRPFYYRRHLTELFGTPDSALVTMQIAGQGKVVLSGVAFSENMEGYFFKNAAISLQAVPAPGFRFVEWQGLGSSNETAVLHPQGDTAFTAVFVPYNNISIIPPVIASDTTLAAAASPWYGFQNVQVLPGARLTVEAGATLLLSDGVTIEVQGGLKLGGSQAQRISVQPDPSPSARRSYYGQSGYWGAIVANSASDSIIVQYTDLRGGSFGQNRNLHFATIAVLNSDLHIANSTITGGKMPLFARGGSAYIGYSEFHTDVPCNGFISLYDIDAPVIEYNIFNGNRAINTDGIDLKGISNGIVRYNQVSGFLGSNCDGIDLGIYSLNNLLEYNIIHDCSDKGISVGSQSSALIRRNLIYDCDLGVAVKDSLALADIDQNTFYGNRIAVACYEKSALRGGGKAHIKNTILSASFESSVFADAKSEIQISYSLSDREPLPGMANIQNDPLLVFPSTGNFELSPQSPCIDAGDPSSPHDPDGSLADMGAYYTHTGNTGLSLLINEFHYHPPFNYAGGDWIELHNATSDTVNLTGWSIRQGLFVFVVNEHTLIEPGGYFMICQDTTLFKAIYPGANPVAGNFHTGLDNKSGKIALYDPEGTLVHSARYADFRPWPPLADGLGATVELSPGLTGNLPVDWRESYVLNGTPGLPNSLPPDRAGLFVNEVLASNAQTLADESGEYDDWFELYNASGDSIDIGGLCFTDNNNDPCKWQAPLHFPEKTTLPPHGFLLLWADGQPEQGLLHLGFRLDADGEMAAIFQRNETTYGEIESLSFGQQISDISWGRYPDGSPVTTLMDPTPGAANAPTASRDQQVEPLQVFPNPFSKHLYVRAEAIAKPFRLMLVNALGQVVFESGRQWQEMAVIGRANLPSGLYTLVLHDVNGRVYSNKVIVGW